MTSRTLTTSPDAESLPDMPATYTHPEEMLFAMELRLPGKAGLGMRFRTTPAGLVSTGVMTALILAGVALIVRRR